MHFSCECIIICTLPAEYYTYSWWLAIHFIAYMLYHRPTSFTPGWGPDFQAVTHHEIRDLQYINLRLRSIALQTKNTDHVRPHAHATTKWFSLESHHVGMARKKPNKRASNYVSTNIKKYKLGARNWKAEILSKAATFNQFLKNDFGNSTWRWRKFKSWVNSW